MLLLLQPAVIASVQASDIIGEEYQVFSRYEDTFADLARSFDLGFNELVQANPDVDPWLPGDGHPIILPHRHILPTGPRQGLVVNLSDYRLYYFAQSDQPPLTFPIGIGTLESPTPLVQTRVTMKLENPTWYPPESIRAEHLRDTGEPLDPAIPPGPENPLGPWAMILAERGYLVHGTNKPMGIGMAVSHGCIRMNNADIERLIPLVAVDTPVRIVRQPVKAAVAEGVVWVEVHEDELHSTTQLGQLLAARVNDLRAQQEAAGKRIELDPAAIRASIQDRLGRPVRVGITTSGDAASPREVARKNPVQSAPYRVDSRS